MQLSKGVTNSIKECDAILYRSIGDPIYHSSGFGHEDKVMIIW